MKKGYDSNFEMNVTTIFPGELYATCQAELITTLLGSCISVALIDPVNRVCGMNHFLLPGASECKNAFSSKDGKYGLFAMPLLIEKMIVMGGCRSNFQAKIFGGSSVLPKYSDYTESVPVNNIKFTLKFLADENIPVLSSDLGGKEGRKVFFVTGKQSVFIKKINSPTVCDIQASEKKNYIKQMTAHETKQYQALSASI